MRDWEALIVSKDQTMEKAVEILENYSRLGICLVVDKDSVLCGTVTDGDVRRALIGKSAMNAKVTEVMNCNPIVARQQDDRQVIEGLMRANFVTTIPVIDQHGKVVNVIRERASESVAGSSTSVVLMAGGFGKRLYPLTKNTPKPLLSVGHKPVLEVTFQNLIDQGFKDFHISTHYLAEMVEAHFGDGSRWGVSISYLREERPLGTAGCLSLLSDVKASYPILVVNGDLLTRVDCNRLLAFHKERKGVATIGTRTFDLEIPYGVVTVEDGYVVELNEKPVESFFVNAGIYALEEEALEYVSPEIALDMPDLLESLIGRGKKVNTFPIHEHWLDIGHKEDYETAKGMIGGR